MLPELVRHEAREAAQCEAAAPDALVHLVRLRRAVLHAAGAIADPAADDAPLGAAEFKRCEARIARHLQPLVGQIKPVLVACLTERDAPPETRQAAVELLWLFVRRSERRAAEFGPELAAPIAEILRGVPADVSADEEAGRAAETCCGALWGLALAAQNRAAMPAIVLRVLVDRLGAPSVRVQETAAGAIYNVLLEAKQREALLAQGGLEQFRAPLQSLNATVQRRCLICLRNVCSGGDRARSQVLQAGLVSAMEPLVFSEDGPIALLAAGVIGIVFAGTDARHMRRPATQSTLASLRTHHRRSDPRTMPRDVVWHEANVALFVELAERAEPELAIAGLLSLLRVALCIPHAESNRTLLQGVAGALQRVYTASGVAEAVQLAKEVLKAASIPTPVLSAAQSQRSLRAALATDSGLLESDPAEWSEDQVVEWVSQSRKFGRYAEAFRAAWVDGDLLLDLDDTNLADMGIAHSVHRKYILRAIARLREQDERVLDAGRKPADVFISYRRVDSEMAHLIRIALEQRGVTVFLDTESLGKGDFPRQLDSQLRSCGHVVVLLTPGALARCSNEGDFVAREIGTALERGRCVPVLHPDFVWPATESLPPALRGLPAVNGVPFSTIFFSAFVDRLAGFLTD